MKATPQHSVLILYSNAIIEKQQQTVIFTICHLIVLYNNPVTYFSLSKNIIAKIKQIKILQDVSLTTINYSRCNNDGTRIISQQYKPQTLVLET